MPPLLRPAAFALALLSPGVAPAFDIAAMTEAERETFRSEIRDYLLENPGVLMEAIAVLEQQQQAEQANNDVALVRSLASDLFASDADWVGGNPEGDITVVEFMDYRCGYCKRAMPEVTELLKSDGNIRFVVKEFPILGEQSVQAARFAVAVLQTAGNAAYAQVHEALMTLRGDIDQETLMALAAEAGADPVAVAARMNSPEVEAVLAENHALAQKLKINGTPSFVFGDRMLRGYAPLDTMRALVKEVREES